MAVRQPGDSRGSSPRPTSRAGGSPRSAVQSLLFAGVGRDTVRPSPRTRTSPGGSPGTGPRSTRRSSTLDPACPSSARTCPRSPLPCARKSLTRCSPMRSAARKLPRRPGGPAPRRPPGTSRPAGREDHPKGSLAARRRVVAGAASNSDGGGTRLPGPGPGRRAAGRGRGRPGPRQYPGRRGGGGSPAGAATEVARRLDALAGDPEAEVALRRRCWPCGRGSCRLPALLARIPASAPGVVLAADRTSGWTPPDTGGVLAWLQAQLKDGTVASPTGVMRLQTWACSTLRPAEGERAAAARRRGLADVLVLLLSSDRAYDVRLTDIRRHLGQTPPPGARHLAGEVMRTADRR